MAATLPAFFCNSPESEPAPAPGHSDWQNVYDTSATYVGIETCRGCHREVYDTYIQTGMGLSFDHATRQKSAADFGNHALVYDRQRDFYYKPFWQRDSLYIMEYRLEGRDTVHKRTERIDYIIGSGQHTNSHIFSRNGYLYQAPITFYTQKKTWDLAPGFEDSANSRFSRLIESECMTCHNGYPAFVKNSQNKYLSLKTGIDCERCHGPGSLHVAQKQAGVIVDTAKTPDYTIVNPRRLTTELQNNICQRCHLQGIAVLNDGKTFFDFRPGMKLSEVMNVFMPQYEGGEDKMIMASHVERMKMSPCYANSGKMSCITCHNPHVSVKFTPRDQYNNACKSCHNGQPQKPTCSETLAVRNTRQDDCAGCHMPRNGSIDIPHVAVTDHFIRRRPTNQAPAGNHRIFRGMKSFNNDRPDAVATARAFMEFYERYNADKGLLDSAAYYLDQEAPGESMEKQHRDRIRVAFLREDFGRVTEYARALKPRAVADAWTAYRIGESFYKSQQAAAALPWYERATALWQYSLDFQSKYGACLLALGRLPDAMRVFSFILSEQPDYLSANTNMGFINMQQGNATLAYDYLKKAQTLDPDYAQNLLNLAVWYHNTGNDEAARRVLVHCLKKHPGLTRARDMLLDLK